MKSILPRNARPVADVADALVLASVEIEGLRSVSFEWAGRVLDLVRHSPC